MSDQKCSAASNAAPSEVRGWGAIPEALADWLGRDAVEILVSAFGGQCITPPRKMGDNLSIFNALIHCDAAAKLEADERKEICTEITQWLIDEYANSVIAVPVSTEARSKARERLDTVRSLPDLSANEIAAKLGITSRWVEKLRQKIRNEDLA